MLLNQQDRKATVAVSKTPIPAPDGKSHTKIEDSQPAEKPSGDYHRGRSGCNRKRDAERAISN
jgi:hypothetical protein